MQKLLSIVAVLAVTGLTTSLWGGEPDDRKVEALIGQQKYQAALDEVRKKLTDPKLGDKPRADLLAQATQLQIALHGYETALKSLKEGSWPKSGIPRAKLALTYANALVSYHSAYSWEIRKREKTVAPAGALDLKAMTSEQIYQEAMSAYLGLWKIRDEIGKRSNQELRPVLAPNNYPEEIRGTLRDSLSHLMVELLSDRSGWTPAQSNEASALELRALLSAGGPKATDSILSNSAVHPLKKISAVLNDLEAWHLKEGRKSAALDARLELHSILHGSLTAVGDRTAILESLEKSIEDQKSNSWSSMGWARLAQLTMNEGKHDSSIRAKKFAEQGAKAHPPSPGAALCRDLIRSIERPSFQLQGMSVDAPGKKSLGVSYQNLTRLHFRSYIYDPRAYAIDSKEYGLRPNARDLEALVKGKPAREWSQEFPRTLDYRSHRALIEPPRHAPGTYAIVASANAGFTIAENQLQGIYQTYGDLAISHRVEPGKNELSVESRSASTGFPVAGAIISLYRIRYGQGGNQFVSKERSDAKGIALFQLASLKEKSGQYSQYFLIVDHDGVTYLAGEHIADRGESGPAKVSSSFVYTDRSIYRPEQALKWKVIAYSGDIDLAKFSVSRGTQLTVELRDANHEVVESHKVKSDEFGSAVGEFRIPAGKALGRWQIGVAGQNQVAVQVEEYKRPTFEVAFDEQTQPMRLNQEARVEGQAKYYFGLPVTAGRIKWSVHRKAILPWWCFWGGWDFSQETRDQLIENGSGEIAKDGRFAVKFLPKADERLAKSKAARDETRYQYRVEIDVTDEGGETRSASQSQTVGFVAVQAAIERSGDFIVAGRPEKIRIGRSTLSGAALAGEGQWELVRLQGPEKALSPSEYPPPAETLELRKDEFRTPDDDRLPRWNPQYEVASILRSWKDGVTEKRGGLKHGSDGIGELELPALNAGAYRLRYRTQDAFGAKYETQAELLVAAAGETAKIPLPGYLGLERKSLKPGEKARLLAFSGFPGQPMVLETFRSGKLMESRELVGGRDISLIEIPVTERDRGGLLFRLRLMRDHQPLLLSEVLNVPWSNQELKIEFSTFRDLIRPGQKEKWTLKILPADSGRKNSVGKGTAQVLAYMYDRSLESFLPHSPERPISVFPYRAHGEGFRSQLGSGLSFHLESSGFDRSSEFRGFSSDQARFFANYGIGGPGARGGPRRSALKMMGAPSSPEKAYANEAVSDVASESAIPTQGLAKQSAAAEAPRIRSNFAETAFWKPQLLTRDDGSVEIEFEAPDSVTSWSVWAHAITRDLVSGSLKKQTQTVKDLMVRPYLPRFVREGDTAEIKVLVNNAGKASLKGKLELEILDPESQKSIVGEFGLKGAAVREFSVQPGEGTSMAFTLQAPRRLGPAAIRVVARAGSHSDGELRPLPVLPGRMHLAQSRFVTLRGKDRKELKFSDLERSDDTTRINEKMVVTLDAQLFYSVLSALPYIVEYPYESSEQILNRFVATGIVSSVFHKYPAIEKMAREFSSRKTKLESWNDPDPNRKMALEESPWLQASRGGQVSEEGELSRILDSRINRNTRDEAIFKLVRMQTASGGFPWFPGGPPSPYMTLYVLYGFSKALEFGVEVPKPMVEKAWGYLHQHYVNELVGSAIAKDCCWETVTFLNYVLSNYPENKGISWTGGVFNESDRKRMLDFSFKNWKEHSPYLKSYLSLTLLRSGRKPDAQLVWESVMDSAKTSDDEGTHWAAEDRSWLWYNDTIETHALAIRTGMELGTSQKQLDGMVQWLFLNKKLNHWKSTRATAEVIYSLTRYLDSNKELGAKEAAQVSLAGDTQKFEFHPDRYTGKKNQIVVEAGKFGPSASPVTVEKSTPGFLFASATWHFSTEQMPMQVSGDFLSVQRKFFRRVTEGGEVRLHPLSDGSPILIGDEVEVQLSIRSKHSMEYVHLCDPRAAGFEPSASLSGYRWDSGLARYEEIRDSATNFFIEWLPQGEYTLKHRMRATTAGEFKAQPATIQPLYAPEFAAYSAGGRLKIR